MQRGYPLHSLRSSRGCSVPMRVAPVPSDSLGGLCRDGAGGSDGSVSVRRIEMEIYCRRCMYPEPYAVRLGLRQGDQLMMTCSLCGRLTVHRIVEISNPAGDLDSGETHEVDQS